MDWLLDSNDLNGRQRHERSQVHMMEGDLLDDVSHQSDSMADFDWSEHIVDGVPTSWIPKISDVRESVWPSG